MFTRRKVITHYSIIDQTSSSSSLKWKTVNWIKSWVLITQYTWYLIIIKSIFTIFFIEFTSVFCKAGCAASRTFRFDDLFCLSYLLQSMSDFLDRMSHFYGESPTFYGTFYFIVWIEKSDIKYHIISPLGHLKKVDHWFTYTAT